MSVVPVAPAAAGRPRRAHAMATASAKQTCCFERERVLDRGQVHRWAGHIVSLAMLSRQELLEQTKIERASHVPCAGTSSPPTALDDAELGRRARRHRGRRGHRRLPVRPHPWRDRPSTVGPISSKPKRRDLIRRRGLREKPSWARRETPTPAPLSLRRQQRTGSRPTPTGTSSSTATPTYGCATASQPGSSKRPLRRERSPAPRRPPTTARGGRSGVAAFRDDIVAAIGDRPARGRDAHRSSRQIHRPVDMPQSSRSVAAACLARSVPWSSRRTTTGPASPTTSCGALRQRGCTWTRRHHRYCRIGERSATLVRSARPRPALRAQQTGPGSSRLAHRRPSGQRA